MGDHDRRYLARAGAAAAAAAVLGAPAAASVAAHTADAGAAILDPVGSWAGWWSGGAWLSDPAAALGGTAFCGGLGILAALLAEDGRIEGDPVQGAELRQGRDARRSFALWDGDGDPDEPGWIVGYDRGGMAPLRRWWVSPWSQTPHALVVAGTGSGKTRRFIIPNVLMAREHRASMVVLDRKGDLADLLGSGLSAAGYRVAVIDHEDGHSAQWDPLAPVMAATAAGDSDRARLSAERAAAAMVPTEAGGRDAHWAESARSVLATCILLVALADGPTPAQRTLASVMATLSDGLSSPGPDPAAQLKALVRSLPSGHPARATGSQLLTLTGRELGSVLSTLMKVVRPYTSEAATWATAPGPGAPPASPRDLWAWPTAVFLRVGGTTSPTNALASLFLQQVIDEADRRTRAGAVGSEIVLLLDELGNVPAVPGLPSAYSLGRSQGLRCLSVVQDTAQLTARYGDAGRREIEANAALTVPLSPSSPEDRRRYSEAVGQRIATTASASSGGGPGGATRGGGAAQTMAPIVAPWDWALRSPDLAIVLRDRQGAPADRGGAAEVPTVDPSATPAGRALGLGDPGHEATSAAEWRSRRMHRAEIARRHRPVATPWIPTWPDTETSVDAADDEVVYEIAD